MLFAIVGVKCVWFVVRCLLCTSCGCAGFNVRCSWCVVRGSMFVVCCLLFVGCLLRCVVLQCLLLLIVVCRSLFDVGCLLRNVVVWCTSFVVCWLVVSVC